MKIAIIGRKKDTRNYEHFISLLPAAVLTTLTLGDLPSCDGVILPGGGDITPAFFGENNTGSRNIDTELDIIQFQAFDYCLRHHLPVMGICKGMQVINVALGGTIIQDLPTGSIHRYLERDQYHDTILTKNTFLHTLYGDSCIVNSAHHQGIKELGRDLEAIQWCPQDHCVEAVRHLSEPVFGLQWHPERLDPLRTTASGLPLLSYFASLAASSAT